MRNIFNDEVIELEIEGAKHKLSFYQDNDSEDPRTWDPISTMLCWHRNYKLGDKNRYDSLQDALEDIAVCAGYSGEKLEELFLIRDDETLKDRDMRVMKELAFFACIKYIYLYDHSGITISTDPFNDPWDSGVVGIVYITKQTAYENLVNVDEISWYDLASQQIETEVDIYDQWLTGDIYGFSLEKLVECSCCNHVATEVIDVMGGFYGSDIHTNGMLEYLPKEVIEYFKEEEENA